MEIWNGALHVHSTYSDGSGDVPDIIAAAKRQRLRFLLLTDHDTLRGRAEHPEGYYGDLLLGFGVEVTPPENHLLAFGVGSVPDAASGPEAFTAEVRRQGGFGFAAHPRDRGSRLLRLPSYPWTADFRHVDGIELLNVMSLWVGRSQTLPQALASLLFRRRCLAVDRATLALWDELLRQRPTPMVAGSDAHAYRFGPLTVFPYDWLLGAVQMVVYLDEAPRGDAGDLHLVYRALRQGRSHAVVRALGEPEGYHFEVGEAVAGGHVPWRSDLRAHLLMPPGGHGRLLQAGTVLAAGDHDLEAKVRGPGPVRAEVYRGRLGWVFSNPVYVDPPA